MDGNRFRFPKTTYQPKVSKVSSKVDEVVEVEVLPMSFELSTPPQHRRNMQPPIIIDVEIVDDESSTSTEENKERANKKKNIDFVNTMKELIGDVCMKIKINFLSALFG